MLQRFRDIQHENVISALGCLQDKELFYAIHEHLPVTLDHLVACPAYPTEIQLASVLTQVGFRYHTNDAISKKQ